MNKFSPFHPYQSYHQADLNSEDQTNRIAMAQQFSYEEVKAKDSTGFKIIASIVYAKAKELAADCPIADYKVVTGTFCKLCYFVYQSLLLFDFSSILHCLPDQ